MNDINWEELQVFYHVARLGSLSAAAEITGISAPTLGRRMLALERSTGKSLFIRKQTGYELTGDGKSLFERVCGMQAIATEIADGEQELLQMPIVTISAGTWTSRFLADSLADLWRPADPFRLCFKTGEARVDLAHREADIGLRNQRPTSGNVAALPAAKVAFAPYCARSFDLNNDCNWVALGSDKTSTPTTEWFKAQKNLWITVWANTPGMLYHLVRGGAGRTLLPCFIGDKDAYLMRAGPLIEELEHQSWIVAHDDERKRPEVRMTIDRMAKLFHQNAGLFAGACSN